MKLSMKLFYVIVIIGIIAILSSCQCPIKRGEKMEYLRVEFFKITDQDKLLAAQLELAKKGARGTEIPKELPGEKFVGIAEYKNGKVHIDVSDSELKKILMSPFTATTGEQKGNRYITKFVVLEPGTLDHLIAVAQEVQGYIGIPSHEEK